MAGTPPGFLQKKQTKPDLICLSFCSIFARRFQSFSTSYLLNYLIYCFLSTLCNVLKSSFVTSDKTSTSAKLLDQFPELQGHFRWLYNSKIGIRV